MNMNIRNGIRLEGEGFDLLPELKKIYFTNGLCLRKALSNNEQPYINRIIFVDCTQKISPRLVLRHEKLTVYVAVVNHHDTQREITLLRAGFHGQVVKNSSLVSHLSAIDCLIKGEMHFTQKALSLYIFDMKFKSQAVNSTRMPLDITHKERQVVDCIFKGLSNQEIAKVLNISLNTVKMHLQNIYRKNNLKGRIQLMSSY